MRVALIGGGTGGHIYPALAIEQALRGECAARNEPYSALFLGTRRGLERTLVEPAGIPLRFVPARPLRRRLSLDVLATIAVDAAGIAVAAWILARFRPDIVIATGGYVTFPAIVAARMLRTVRCIRAPLVLLEENARPGLVNRLLVPLVDEVWGAFPASASALGKRFVMTGVPVRRHIVERPSKARARANLGIDPQAFVVVVMGGSQGARSINLATSALVTRRTLPANWWIVHVSGERDYGAAHAALREKPAENRVTLLPYLDDPGPAYAAADLVVARAGASTLAELAATGTPSLLIPYPHASEDHQAANARVFEDAGAAAVVADASLDGDALWWKLQDLAAKTETRAAMAAAAAALAPTEPAATIARRVTALTGGAGRRGGEERRS
ncbi:MAG: undecaprenyldiphospho-muramoylpentapeptide beta-N-acetylglucosaminyltransferase [Candidatus Eremiobacteraeota bacterium]|nr:undecaprenyldiphospho-muramoylpentapeptide beta-N-acetylglucosaminyltransferase [Candidatus Eremiobacteraeota bacterium]MBV8354126.1 undecaprenyldiphospho-muramoylpentapeptide beta-N-acetylglucosaminyltransferase [Candidatus Eremiobacteraeota bacterium]